MAPEASVAALVRVRTCARQLQQGREGRARQCPSGGCGAAESAKVRSGERLCRTRHCFCTARAFRQRRVSWGRRRRRRSLRPRAPGGASGSERTARPGATSPGGCADAVRCVRACRAAGANRRARRSSVRGRRCSLQAQRPGGVDAEAQTRAAPSQQTTVLWRRVYSRKTKSRPFFIFAFFFGLADSTTTTRSDPMQTPLPVRSASLATRAKSCCPWSSACAKSSTRTTACPRSRRRRRCFGPA